MSVFQPAGKKDRREVGRAFLASILFHLLLLLLLLIGLADWWQRDILPKPPEEEPMELTILPPPPPAPPPVNYVDTSSLTASEKPPEATNFESDRDTLAASELPPVTDSPLPSQEGREEPFLELANQQMSLGPTPLPTTPSPASEEQPQTQQQEASETPPAETSKETEPGEEELPPESGDLALLKPVEVRRAEPVVPQEVRRAEATRASMPSPPGFQPERRTTRIQGGVSNRGRSSVDALGTPLGRYKKMLSDAIGSRWYFYVNNEIGLLAVGTTTIRFIVTASGRVTGLQILSNSSNESFASVSIRSILEAEIPPIPPDVAEHLENNRIEVDYTFSILSN